MLDLLPYKKMKEETRRSWRMMAPTGAVAISHAAMLFSGLLREKMFLCAILTVIII